MLTAHGHSAAKPGPHSGFQQSSQADDAPDAAVPQLPQDLIACVLHHVSPSDRLTSCALVCKAWHATCCASTTSMSLTCDRQVEANAAFSWLSKHGKGVSSVCITVSEAAERLCLDCDLQVWSWLKDLRLTGFNLRQGPSPADFPDHSPDIAALMARSAIVRCNSSSRLGELTSLTRLDLDGCAVPDDLAALSKLTDLQHLTVSVMTHHPAGVSCLPFQALPKLTHLHIGVDVCDSTCAHLSSLTALQQLHISKYASISSAGLAQIGALAQLTFLRVNGAPYVIDPVSVPGFSALLGLKHLEVTSSKELNPAVLDGLTALEHLALIQTPVNPRGVSPSAAAGVPSLLALLPRMQQLTYLNLTDCLSWPQPAHAYAALTASPTLVKLVLRSSHLPSGICEHMFGPGEGRLRAQLTHLALHTSWPVNMTLEAGDVDKLVACCPGLRHLDADLGQQSVEELLPLKALTGLTFLATSDITDAGLSVLAQLQPLKQLDFERARTVTAQGLAHLTALKGLTQLRAPGSACVFGAHQHCRMLHLKSRCQGSSGEGGAAAQEPDVWSQLDSLLQRQKSAAEAAAAASRVGGWGWHSQRGGGAALFERGGWAELAELRELILATEALGHRLVS